MFSPKLASLSAYSELGFEIVRDCDFYAVGKIPTKLDRRVVPIGSAKFLRELMFNMDGVAGVVCCADVASEIPEEIGCAISDDPLGIFYKIHAERIRDGAYWETFPSRIDPTAKIHPKAHISETDVIIGPETIVEPGAVIMERSIIGARCHIGPNTVVGTKAYEMGKIEGVQKLLPQIGGVFLGDDVTLLSGVTIAISMFPIFTKIGSRSSVDNLCHIAHDCVIGEDVKITAGATLSGRVTLQDRAYIGPGSTISNGVTVGSGAKVTIGSVVIEDVAEKHTVAGNFAISHKDHLRAVAKMRRKSRQ